MHGGREDMQSTDECWYLEPQKQIAGSGAHRVERVLGNGHQDGVILIAQQQAHHGMHALAGAVCQVQEVWVAGVPISLLDSLQNIPQHLKTAVSLCMSWHRMDKTRMLLEKGSPDTDSVILLLSRELQW